MKRLFLIFSLALVPLFALAQQANDVIYLNNGNIVKGEILSSDKTKVTMRTTTGSTYTYNRVEIRRIDNGEQVENMPSAPESRYRDYSSSTKGFWAAAELAGGLSIDHDSAIKATYPVDLHFTFGYRFSEFLQVGVGVGFRHYFDGKMARCYIDGKQEREDFLAGKCKPEDYQWAFPIYANVRGLFLSGQSRSVVPYWSVEAGHAINDGFMASPTLGLRIGDMERHHFLVGLSYTAQYTRLWGKADHSYKFGCLHVLQLKLGYQF